jgi:hypothetical protein
MGIDLGLIQKRQYGCCFLLLLLATSRVSLIAFTSLLQSQFLGSSGCELTSALFNIFHVVFGTINIDLIGTNMRQMGFQLSEALFA